jgi:hypothetical protein
VTLTGVGGDCERVCAPPKPPPAPVPTSAPTPAPASVPTPSGRCASNINEKRCVRVTYGSGLNLRQAPCRDFRPILAVLPGGSTVCASEQLYRSSCREPHQWIYVTNGFQYGFVMALDGRTRTLNVEDC